MQGLLDSLVNSVLPNVSKDVKKTISELITATIEDPKNGLKKYLAKTLVAEFTEKNKTENSNLADILKNSFNFTDDQYETLKKMGVGVFDLFSVDKTSSDTLVNVVRVTPFSTLEVYVALARVALKYGLNGKVKEAFESEQTTAEIAQLIQSLNDMGRESKQQLSGSEFIDYLCELVRLLFGVNDNPNAESILSLLEDKEFRKFLMSRNEKGELNISNLRKPTTSEVSALFKSFVTKLSKTDYNFNLYVGNAVDYAVLGIQCSLVKTLEQLEDDAVNQALTPEIITKVKNNTQSDCTLIYLCEINEMFGVIALHKKDGQQWVTTHKIVLDKQSKQEIKSELHDLIALQLANKLNELT